MFEIYNKNENVKPAYYTNTEAQQVKYDADDNTSTEDMKTAIEADNSHIQATDDYPYNMLTESLW